jgi:REP element-mobilizing transposase RayT
MQFGVRKAKHPFWLKTLEPNILSHIKENAHQKQIYIDTINGHVDHIHCLFGLNADMSIAKALNLMKGESSHWINKNGLNEIQI